MPRMVQYLNPGRSRQPLNIISQPRRGDGADETAFDDGISTVATNGRLVLHVRE